ncbi:MAG TPA: glycosyltransferase family 2 protein [Candidatus Polarisedimenticolaceae bacterium]|nr:glycosyltransferase family 2 protein [Candidatus Polarisedimenticolaceae bacterium]
MSPRLSVVIPTRNRAASLRRLLHALAPQVQALEAEVLVAADACDEDTAAAVLRWPAPFPCTLVEVAGRGASAARAAGARAAGGDLLLFLDDDMEPEPGLLAAHVAAHAGQPPGAVMGASPPRLDPPLNFFRLALRDWWEDDLEERMRPGHRATFRDLQTGNLSLPACLLARAGGFDPALPCREDHELGIRLLALSAEFRFVPGALAWHRDGTTLEGSFRRARLEGRGDVAIARRHPDLAAVLPFALPRTPPWVERLAFDHPRPAAPIAAALTRALRALEGGRFRRRYRRLYALLREYAYWRGVAEETGSLEELEALLRVPAPREGRVLDLDLAHGLRRAEGLLDAWRPAGARLQVGPWWVGYLPALPGAEPLRGRHLRPALSGSLAVPYLQALALAGAVPGGDLGLPLPFPDRAEHRHAG